MEVHFRDILVSLKFNDYSFTNPVPVKWNQDGEVIGSATLKVEKKKLYADLVIQDHIKYNNVYPHLAVDVISQSIGFVFLDQNKGIDPEVEPLTAQLSRKKK
jgi:hypothetical protein